MVGGLRGASLSLEGGEKTGHLKRVCDYRKSWIPNDSPGMINLCWRSFLGEWACVCVCVLGRGDLVDGREQRIPTDTIDESVDQPSTEASLLLRISIHPFPVNVSPSPHAWRVLCTLSFHHDPLRRRKCANILSHVCKKERGGARKSGKPLSPWCGSDTQGRTEGRLVE